MLQTSAEIFGRSFFLIFVLLIKMDFKIIITYLFKKDGIALSDAVLKIPIRLLNNSVFSDFN